MNYHYKHFPVYGIKIQDKNPVQDGHALRPRG